MPKVSVVIPSYNHEKYISECIQSVLDQTFQDFEIIITDDGSSDNTVQEIKKFTDKRIKLFVFEKNQGAAVAVNHCIKNATGEYIAMMNSDDVFVKDKLEQQVEFLEKNNGFGAVVSHLLPINEEGDEFFEKKIFDYTYFEKENRSRYEWMRFFFFGENAFAHPSALIRRKCYQKVGLYDERFAQVPDWDFWIRLCQKYEVHIMPKRLLKYRIRSNNQNVSADKPERRTRTTWEMIFMLENFLNLDVFEIKKVFPELENTPIKDIVDIKYNLALLAINNNITVSHKIFGLSLLFELISDKSLSETLKSRYNFSFSDLIKLSGSVDIVGSKPLFEKKQGGILRKIEQKILCFIKKYLNERVRSIAQHFLPRRCPIVVNKLFEDVGSVKNVEEISINRKWAVDTEKDSEILGLYKETLVEIQEKERSIQEKDDELYDLYHSSIVGPIIRLRNKLRKWKFQCGYYKANLEWRVLCFAKKHLSEKTRARIRPFLPSKFRTIIKWARNERWNGPLISIVTPFYNHGSTINETVDSVLNQTFQNFEYIIVNDGSTDIESGNVFERINHQKISKISQENKGVAEARNTGIRLAKGKYILCLDSDDRIDPTYLEKALIVLESNPGVDIVYSDMFFFGIEERVYFEPEFNPKTLFRNNIITTAAVFRKEAWEKVGGYKPKIGFEDWEFWINLVENGSVARRIPEPLFLYRRSVQSRYIDDKKKKEANILAIQKLHWHYFKKIKKIANCRYIFSEDSQFVNFENENDYLHGNDRKNILLLMPWLTFGGAETVVYNYCSRINSLFNFSIVTGHPSKNEWEWRFKEVVSNIFHLPVLFRGYRKAELDFILNYIKVRKIDVAHIIHNSYFYWMVPKIKEVYPQIKIVSTAFNAIADHFMNSIEQATFIDINTTDNTKVQHLFQQSGISENKTVVIHNGIDCYEKFNPVNYDRKNERRKLGLENDDLAVYFIGRLSPEKNPNIFVDVAKKMLTENNRTKFFIVGDGPMKNSIEKSINAIGNNNIKYLGYQDDIPRFLSTADVFVLPSKIEGFPLSNIEAMSMGVCVISSDVGGVSDAISNGVNGFLVQPGSSQMIVDKINLILSDKELKNQISENARRSVEEHFSIELLASKYEEIYSKL